MNQGECSGEIIFIGETEQITPNFSKRIIALKYTDGQRGRTPSFEFINPTKEVDKLVVGMKVHISFKPGGNRGKTDPKKFYPSMEVINISRL